MKKVTILLSVFALVMGLSQCRKPSFSALNGGETQHVVLNASWDGGGSKIDENGALGLKWTLGDKITVRQGGNPIGTLECVDVAAGIFEGYIMRTGGKVTFTFGTNDYNDADDFKNQTGASLNGAVYLTSGEYPYDEGGNYGTVSMTMPHAVLKLDLSKFAGTKTDEGVTVTIKGGAEEVTVIGVTAGSKELYVAMPAEESATAKTYTFSGNGKVATVKNWPLKTNTFYTSNVETGTAIVIEPTHEYVDLGLPSGTLWATCNVGAASPEERGDYFAWGATTTWYSNLSPLTWKSDYSNGYVWKNCPGNGGFASYNSTSFNTWKAENLADGVLKPAVDVAHVNWGGDWRMPTAKDWEELLDNKNATNKWINQNGVDGRLFTSTKDSSKTLFIPAAGRLEDKTFYTVGTHGYYWSSSLNTDDQKIGLQIRFYDKAVNWPYNTERRSGLSVRPVR